MGSYPSRSRARVTGLDEGDRADFRDRLESIMDGLYGSALRLTRNPADAEDLVAEAVARAWANFGTLQDRQCFPKWVHRILVNAFFSNRRRNRAEQAGRVDLPEEHFSLFEKIHQPFLLWWSNPERELINKLLREDIARALDALPDPYRAVVVLAEIECLTYGEIAQVLDLPVGTVRSRLNRARAMLQKALWRHAREAGLLPGTPGRETP
jgi:RNA polymerase sigma-70 factor, ECF subfamily